MLWEGWEWSLDGEGAGEEEEDRREVRTGDVQDPCLATLFNFPLLRPAAPSLLLSLGTRGRIFEDEYGC